jgi:glutamine cyclotransferase
MGAPVCSYQVVNRFPHAPDAFTQGLVFHDGRLLESTGIEGQSSLRRVVLETGEVIQRVDVDAEYFAEGIAIVEDRVHQITWTDEQGFTYDVVTFDQLGEFTYAGEGWGLTYDGSQLVMSNGTAQLTRRNPDTFQPSGTIDVTSGGEPVTRLNELEYIEGQIWANVWQTDRIARIDPETGNVESWLDLTGLLPDSERTANTSVLNGIAYDDDANRLFVTGKFWPWLYEIRVTGC